MLNQDSKNKIKMRKSRPQTLAASFGGLLESFGVRASDSDLVENWQSIVGTDIARIANVVAIKVVQNKKFNIVLRPVSPAFALELSYKIEECKKKINKYYGYDAVSKITIRK